MERLVSSDYIIKTAQNYGLLLGGRAINIEEEYSALKPADSIADSRPCRRLISSDHFHVDLNGKFIPPGCTGISIDLKEAIRGIPVGKYPVFEALLSGGTVELMQYAQSLGFVKNQHGYTSSCALCFHIRHWLCQHGTHIELDLEHYSESLKYYN